MKKTTVGSIFFILGITAVFISLMALLPSASSEAEEKAQIRLLKDGWYYMKDGVKTPVELPATIRPDQGEALILYNDSLTQNDVGMTLTTRGAAYGLQVSMGDRLLYKYDDPYFPRNDQMKSKYDCDIQLPADQAIGVLKATYHQEKAQDYAIAPFYIGSGGAVMWLHLMDTALAIGIAFLFILLSLVGIGIAIYLHFSRIDHRRFLDTAIFLLICSIWFITDSSLAQRQSGNAAAVCIASFYAFMLLAVPMLYFIKHTADLKASWILDLILGLFYLNALLQGVLHLALKIAFRDMLFATHLLLVIGVGVSSILLVKEYQKSKNRDIGMVLTAFAVLGASGILSLALYWILKIPYYGAIFEIGILLFVLLIIANIVISMVENFHYRTEMQVYQRMLREDWMTGMENRLPFEEHLGKIQKNPDEYKDATLIFLKINQLKTTNDESGQVAGDKLILGAAKCISETFGKVGRCYRLEGDEFCVIIEQLQSNMEEFFQRLDLEIRKYNRSNPYWLSIARGWRHLGNENGSWKTISDWKLAADGKLYENRDEMNAT